MTDERPTVRILLDGDSIPIGIDISDSLAYRHELHGLVVAVRIRHLMAGVVLVLNYLGLDGESGCFEAD